MTVTKYDQRGIQKFENRQFISIKYVTLQKSKHKIIIIIYITFLKLK